MAELAAAMAALAGKGSASSATPKPLSPSALGSHTNWFVPPALLRLPGGPVRVAALAAHDCSLEAVNHPSDFDKVYRYGLSLQVGAGLWVLRAQRTVRACCRRSSSNAGHEVVAGTPAFCRTLCLPISPSS